MNTPLHTVLSADQISRIAHIAVKHRKPFSEILHHHVELHDEPDLHDVLENCSVFHTEDHAEFDSDDDAVAYAIEHFRVKTSVASHHIPLLQRIVAEELWHNVPEQDTHEGRFAFLRHLLSFLKLKRYRAPSAPPV